MLQADYHNPLAKTLCSSMAGQCQLSYSPLEELETKLYCCSDKWFYMPE